MANVEGTFYSATTQRRGVTPVSPPNAVDDPVDPVSPPIGSHPPVTIGTPSNGLSIDAPSQVLSIGIASSGVTGALSGTDWNTFNGKLNLTSPITGYTVGSDTALTETDSILQAFEKVQGQINARVSGTGVSGQVAFFNGTGSVAGDTGFVYDSVNDRVGIGSGSGVTSGYDLEVLKSNTARIISKTSSTTSYSSFEARNSGTSVLNIVKRGVDATGTLFGLPLANAAQIYAVGGSLTIGTFDNFNLNFVSSSALRWSILGAGILQSNGAQTIQTSTGNLTLATAAGDGNILINPHGTGMVGINTSPTNKLDINGDLRVRTIANLGTAATSVLVPSATGVVSLRTLAEFRGDLGATTLGANLFTIPNPSAITFPRFNADNTVSALSASDFSTAIGAQPLIAGTLTEGYVATVVSGVPTWATPSLVVDTNKVSYNVADAKTASERIQARVNIGSTSSTPQVIATAGAINDLATTSNHLVFTGESVVLSGIVAGLDGEEFTILNASGTNLELLSQSALSTAGNRFASGVIVPNLSILRIKYRTTSNRWFLENVGINDGRYVRKDVADTKTGDLTIIAGNLSPQAGNGGRLDWITSAISGNGDGAIRFGENGEEALRIGRDNVTGGGRSIPQFSKPVYFYSNTDWRSGGLSGTNTAKLTVSTGRLFHARSGASNESVRRDELYLNYSETVGTAGTINDLAINSSTKLLILTGATDLTGVVPVDNTRLLRIEARGASRIIRHESASSTAANRFSIGSDLTINAGEVYQFIYTDSRWRRIL